MHTIKPSHERSRQLKSKDLLWRTLACREGHVTRRDDFWLWAVVVKVSQFPVQMRLKMFTTFFIQLLSVCHISQIQMFRIETLAFICIKHASICLNIRGYLFETMITSFVKMSLREIGFCLWLSFHWPVLRRKYCLDHVKETVPNYLINPRGNGVWSVPWWDGGAENPPAKVIFLDAKHLYKSVCCVCVCQL